MAEDGLAEWKQAVELDVAELARMDLDNILFALMLAGQEMTAASKGNTPGNYAPGFVVATHRVLAAAGLLKETCRRFNEEKGQ